MKRNNKKSTTDFFATRPALTKVEAYVSIKGHLFRFSGNMLAMIQCPVGFVARGRFTNVFGGNGLMNEINSHLVNNFIFDGQEALDYVLSIGGTVVETELANNLLQLIKTGDVENINLAKVIGSGL